MGKNIIIIILLIGVLSIAGYFITQNYQASLPGSEGKKEPVDIRDSQMSTTSENNRDLNLGTSTNVKSNTSTTSESTIKEFSITAKQFTFTPNIITVNTGDTVRLIIKSVDVSHGISIKEFNVNQILPPNKTETIEFIASIPGTYQMSCSVACGAGHRDMKGTLVVK